MYQLIVGLEGGLGNRMRVAAATATLAPLVKGEVAAFWTPQWGMGCRFDELFQPYHEANLVLRDATLAERFFTARPRPRNLYLSRYLHKVIFRESIYSHQVTDLCRQHFDFAGWANRGPALLWSWWDFLPWEPQLLSRLFRPLPALAQRIDERTEPFSPHTIGVHIRRTDNQQSIEESPTELFFDAIDGELDKHSDTRVYVATDDEPTKRILRQRYGNQRIITPDGQAVRDTARGIQDALVEMFALSRTHHIYGSAGSSFSEMAARLKGTPLTILQRNTPSS